MRYLLALLGLALVFPRILSAQSKDTVRVSGLDTLCSIGQESIPSNDSGGRWIETRLVLKSASAYPVYVTGFPTKNLRDNRTCAPNFDFVLSDSAWLLADSIIAVIQQFQGTRVVSYGTPTRYRDSLPTLASGDYYRSVVLQYAIPPHGTLRIPYLFQAIGPFGQSHGDTAEIGSDLFISDPELGTLYAFRDSLVGNTVFRRLPQYRTSSAPPIYAVAPSSAPYHMTFKGTWNNRQHPVVLGQLPAWYFGFQDTVRVFERTKATFQVVGEYSDRFVAPSDTIITQTCVHPGVFPGIQLRFVGAPRSMVRDTLVSTFTDDWGSIVERTPIEAYTVISGGYQIAQNTGRITAPFLGSTNDTIYVDNLSEFPIQLKNLTLVNLEGASFEIASKSSVIASYDKGMIVVRLLDNDKWRDVDNPLRTATLTGTITAYQTDVTMLDSNFSVGLDGVIDVYSPQASVLNLPPQLKRGIHPRGIIFTSSVSSSKGPGTFISGYGNDDPNSEYFYSPYYADPNFSVKIGNFLGLGSRSLPGLLPPDTGVSTGVEALTQFTGDSKHNYLTKMYWPRQNDTIVIDVLALGEDAPPFDGVSELHRSPANVSIWPNPTSRILRASSVEGAHDALIVDDVGRIARRQKVRESDPIDVSTLVPGTYELIIPDLQKRAKFQISR